MAFSTTIQQIEKPVPVNTPSNDITDALLSMVILSLYGAKMSKKSLRKLKRKFFWTSLKLKFQSFFHPRNVSDRTLIYILLGAVFLILIIVSPIAALVLVALALILILAGVI